MAMADNDNLRDPLTGVLSRASLEDRIRDEVERARRYDEHLSILLLDLDHFKSVNDAFGHARGDAVLSAFARRVRQSLRASDVMFRFGGDEFVVVLPHTTKARAVALAERLCEATRSTPAGEKPALALTTSVGVACFPEDAASPDALMEKADVRLYEAKRRGRDCPVAEDPPVEKVPAIRESTRLVEREVSLEVLGRFLDQLDTKRRGVLVVTGEPGAGRSRFLQEVGRAARVRGYLVVAVDARRSLTGRAHGALAEALAEQETPLPVSVSEGEFHEALEELLHGRDAPGVVFTVDGYADLDRETQELLQWLLGSPSVRAVGCAYVARREDVRRSVPLEAPMVEAVELAPFTRRGTRLWVRHALGWEAPDDFVRWLHMHTRGLPGLMQKVVLHLVRRGLLVRTPDGWSFGRDFRDVPLEEVATTEELSPRHNLPLMLTTFVGRVSELTEAKRMLRRGRLLTILGPGGIGKTRLALQIAAEVMEEYTDGVFHVPLATVLSGHLIPLAVADAMRFEFQAITDPEAQLLDVLRTKKMLLVLDNFEHLLEGAPVLTQILRTAAGVSLLVTTRERLRIEGEDVLALSGLRTKWGEGDIGVEGPSAVRLFVRSALRADPTFAPDQADREAIVRICRAVEGMPLAIEMAAGWITTLGCREIADAVSSSLDVVDGHFRDAPARHRSIRAVFEQSWEQLSPDERDALSKLSVFPSGFRREAAGHVAGGTLPILSALLDKSFLRRVTTGRFQIHELLRRCAAEKLLQDQSRNFAAHDAHCAYYAKWLGGLEVLQTAEEWSTALTEMGSEIDNVRAAWRWAIDHTRADYLEACTEAVSRLYEARSLFREGYEEFGRAAGALAGHDPDRNGATDTRSRRAYARALVRRGIFARNLALLEEARAALEKGLALLREIGCARDTALALRQLGMVVRELGQYPEAKAYLVESRAVCDDVKCALDIALTLNELGTTSWRQGEYREAEEFYRQSIETCNLARDPTGAATPMGNLAGVLFHLGQLEQGRQMLERAVEAYKETGNRRAVASCLNNLGLLAWRMGDRVPASELLRECVALQREIGDRGSLMCGLNNLGIVSWELSEYGQARRYFLEALEVAVEAGDRLRTAISQSGLGDVAYALAHYAESAEHYRQSLRTAVEISASPQIAEGLVSFARLYGTVGRGERALELAALAAHHPSAQKDTRDRAERLQAEISSAIPAGHAEAAVRRGRGKKLEDAAAEILAAED
jgi:diguanylate cyclase (GGDEF)-like protein